MGLELWQIGYALEMRAPSPPSDASANGFISSKRKRKRIRRKNKRRESRPRPESGLML
jgi:hypothetical protein